MRPVRNTLENITDKIPRGPLGFLGGGNAVGATGLTLVSISRTFIPVDEFGPGFSVEGVEKTELSDGKVERRITINAYSKDVARFVGKRKSAPSNLDFALSDIEVKDVKPLTERSTSTTWLVVTESERRDAAKVVEGENNDNN